MGNSSAPADLPPWPFALRPAVLIVAAAVLILVSGQSAQDTNSDFLIIGAGVAGIAAAQKLAVRGITNFTILEARNRVGGRIHTVNFGGETLDLGAQYIYAHEGNSVYDIIKDMRVMYNPRHRKTTVSGPGGIFMNKTIINQMMEMRTHPGQITNRNQTFGEYFVPRFKAFMSNQGIEERTSKMYLDVIRKLFSIHNGGDISEVGLWGVFKYRESAHGRSAQWKDGFFTFIEILLGKYNRGKSVDIINNILLEKEVTGVRWGDKGVTVHCSDGSTHSAKAALVTLPLGVLRNVPMSFFQPPLPTEKQMAVQHLGYGTVDKIFVLFDENITDGKNVLFGMSSKMKKKFVKAEQKGFWPTKLSGFCPTRDSDKLINTWIVGENARTMEQLSNDQVTNGCISMMKLILQSEIPFPKAILRSSWGTDKYSMGSYSFRTPESENVGVSHLDLGKPLFNSKGLPVILFAGEATHEEHYGTVHGALESGWREAENIIKYFL